MRLTIVKELPKVASNVLPKFLSQSCFAGSQHSTSCAERDPNNYGGFQRLLIDKSLCKE